MPFKVHSHLRNILHISTYTYLHFTVMYNIVITVTFTWAMNHIKLMASQGANGDWQVGAGEKRKSTGIGHHTCLCFKCQLSSFSNLINKAMTTRWHQVYHNTLTFIFQNQIAKMFKKIKWKWRGNFFSMQWFFHKVKYYVVFIVLLKLKWKFNITINEIQNLFTA